MLRRGGPRGRPRATTRVAPAMGKGGPDPMGLPTEEKKKLYTQYQSLLLDGVVPFWLERGIDREHGGVLSCMSDDGQVLSGDKFIWSQARSVWTFSALYNRIEPRPEFLEAAENSVRFLLAHGRSHQRDRCDTLHRLRSDAFFLSAHFSSGRGNASVDDGARLLAPPGSGFSQGTDRGGCAGLAPIQLIERM